MLKVACVGCGVIGHSWATLFSMKGCDVVLHDVSDEALGVALKRIDRNLRFLEEKAFIGCGEAKASIHRITCAQSIAEAVVEADYIQESVYEQYEVKKEVFREVDVSAPPLSIIASSTSTLSMTVIQKATENPGRCIVVHPYNPPHIIPLVELIPGLETSLKVVDETRGFMDQLGKVPIIMRKEVGGGVGNRLAAALWREALDLVNKGVVSVEDVDKAVWAGPGLRWAIMGPSLTYHLAGGEGGIEYFLQHLGPSMGERWRTMGNWTDVPDDAVLKLVQGVKEMEMVRNKTREEIVEWRDGRLLELLKVLFPAEGRER